MEEIWKTIQSAPHYEASSLGRIRRNGRVLKPYVEPDYGYETVNLRINGRSKTKRVHRLVCEAFYGPPPKGKNDTAHGDGVRTNNIITNLRWASRKENMADSIAHGTTHAHRGSNNSNSKLTEDQVIAIRAAPRRRGILYELAEKYGVSRNVVGNIRTKGSPCWNHIR